MSVGGEFCNPKAAAKKTSKLSSSSASSFITFHSYQHNGNLFSNLFAAFFSFLFLFFSIKLALQTTFIHFVAKLEFLKDMWKEKKKKIDEDNCGLEANILRWKEIGKSFHFKSAAEKFKYFFSFFFVNLGYG